MVVSILALLVALGAAAVAVRSVLYVRRTTHVQEENLRVTKTPLLVATPMPNTSHNQAQWFYTVRNDGPQDLDDVQMHPPEPRDSVIYALAPVGGAWAAGVLPLGPLRMGSEVKLSLAVGGLLRDRSRPVFRVRVEAAAGTSRWTVVVELDEPTSPPQPARQRQAKFG